jgi:hypothetical protein
MKNNASRIAEKYIDHVDIFYFDHEGQLWVHVAVAEIVCEILGAKDAASHLVNPLLEKIQEEIRDCNTALEISDNRSFCHRVLRASIIEDIYCRVLESRKRLETWLMRAKRTDPNDPRRMWIPATEDECEKLAILSGVIGIEQLLTGIDVYAGSA